MSGQLPAYGPSELFEDEGVTAHVIVRVAVALSREQLETALAIGVTEHGGADPASMSAEDVRREVEGLFAACGTVEIDNALEAEDGWWPGRARPDGALFTREAIAAAIDQAYPEVAR